MREIMANGPIIMDFNAGHEFQKYKGGVMIEKDSEALEHLNEADTESIIEEASQKDVVSDRINEDYNLQWQ